jgi:hypothetical protein
MLGSSWIFYPQLVLTTSSLQKQRPAVRFFILMHVWADSVFFVMLNSLQYVPTAALVAGVKAGVLHQGHFNANQYNYLEVRIPKSPFLHSLMSSTGQCPSPGLHQARPIDRP